MLRTRNVVSLATSVDLDSVVVVVVVTGLVIYFLMVTLPAGGIFGCVGGFSTSLVIFDTVIDLVLDDALRAEAVLIVVGFEVCDLTVRPAATVGFREFVCVCGCGPAFILSTCNKNIGKQSIFSPDAFRASKLNFQFQSFRH